MTVADHGSAARRALPYAVGLLALAAAAGCTASSPPSPPSSAALTTTATSSTTSAVVTPTATATPSVDPVIAKIPAAARPETIEGAEAFGRYYLEQVNRSFTEGSPKPLDGLAQPSCEVCTALYESARELSDAGKRHKGLSIEVQSATANRFDNDVRTVMIWIEQHAVPIVDEKGRTVDRTTGDKGAFLATLTYSSHWAVSRLQVVK